MINKLKTRFENLQDEYFPLLEKANTDNGYVAYCDQDFFTLEPFHTEIYNLDISQMKLVADPEELKGSQLFQVLVSDGKALLHREWLGENCRYDGLFIYEENKKSRLVVYVKDGKVKPICIEILERDEQGAFKSFCCINQYGAQEFQYHYDQFIINVDAFNYQEDGTREKIHSLRVNLSEQDYSVSRIELTDRNSTRIIYNAEIKNQGLEELLKEALTCKTDDLVTICQNDPELVDKEIHCILLEYSSQNPMHCSFAFIQPHEVNTTKDNRPLAWLNAPDAELFMDDASDHDSLYEKINRLFDTMQDKEFAEEEKAEYDDEPNTEEDNTVVAIDKNSQQLIKEFYVKLCKSVKTKIRNKTSLILTEEFYVCARDFEACNEEEYLEAILPVRQFKKIRKTIETYEKKQAKRKSNDPTQIKIQEMKQISETLLPELMLAAEKMPADYWYSDEHLYFIEPFRFEQKTGHPTDRWQDLLSREIPSASFYFRYQMNGDKPVSIAQISENKIVRQWYWKTDINRILEIEYYCFKGTPHVESCNLLELIDGKPFRYTECCLFLDEKTYQLDDSGKIAQSRSISLFPGHPDDGHVLELFYEYEAGKISKIYRKPMEWDSDERLCIYFPNQHYDDLE